MCISTKMENTKFAISILLSYEYEKKIAMKKIIFAYHKYKPETGCGNLKTLSCENHQCM